MLRIKDWFKWTTTKKKRKKKAERERTNCLPRKRIERNMFVLLMNHKVHHLLTTYRTYALRVRGHIASLVHIASRCSVHFSLSSLPLLYAVQWCVSMCTHILFQCSNHLHLFKFELCFVCGCCCCCHANNKNNLFFFSPCRETLHTRYFCFFAHFKTVYHLSDNTPIPLLYILLTLIFMSSRIHIDSNNNNSNNISSEQIEEKRYTTKSISYNRRWLKGFIIIQMNETTHTS